MSTNPSPDPLISRFAAIRTYAEATALAAPAIYGLRQFFRYITPTPPRTETQDARVLHPSLLDHDDSVERNHPQRGTRLSSRGTQTPAAQPAKHAIYSLETAHVVFPCGVVGAPKPLKGAFQMGEAMLHREQKGFSFSYRSVL